MYKLEHMPVSLRDCILNQLINKLNMFNVIAITLLFVNETIHRRVLGVLTHSLSAKKTQKTKNTNQKTQPPKKSNTQTKKPN